MAFKVTRRTGNGGEKTTSGTENVLVRLKSLHLVDTTYAAERRQPRPNKDDYAIVTLMHPALGFDFQMNENYEPLTEVKVTLRENSYTGENKPYQIADFRKNASKGNGPKMGSNPILMLEGCWKDFNTDAISAGWLHCIKPDSEASLYASLEEKTDHVMADVWATVKEERETEDRNNPGQKRPRQDRFVYITDSAEQVDSVEALKAADVTDWLYSNPNAGGGLPVVMLRLSQLNGTEEEPTTPVGLAVATIYGGQLENGEPKHKDQIIDDFLEAVVANDKSEDKESNFKFYLENLKGESNYVIEAIPAWRYSTGPKSLPSAQKPGRRHDHQNFRSVVIDEDNNVVTRTKDGVEEDVMSQMITRAHMVVRRGQYEDGMGTWYATNTTPTKSAALAEFHSIMDLPAASTPEVLVAAFMAKSDARQAYTQAKINERKGQKAAKTADAEEAKPDQSGGLTPAA